MPATENHIITEERILEIVETRDVISENHRGDKVKRTRMTGIVQKSGVFNSNKRRYSADVLNEAVNAIQENIQKRRVLGELDHPCLTTNDFRVLTVNGWKHFRDVKIGDKVYSRVNGVMVESGVLDIIDEPYNGDVYHFCGRHIDVEFTGPHRVIIDDESGNQIECTAQSIFDNKESYDNYIIPTQTTEHEECSDPMTIASLKIEKRFHDGRIYCLTTEHGNFYMELNGRSFWTGNSDAKIHIDRISHVMTKVWIDGSQVYGELEVLEDMPCGRVLKTLIESNITVGISSRGVGDLQPIMIENTMDEGYEVMPGYRFITWDIVAEPSVQEAELSVLESIQRSKKRMTKSEEEQFLKNFSRLLRG